ATPSTDARALPARKQSAAEVHQNQFELQLAGGVHVVIGWQVAHLAESLRSLPTRRRDTRPAPAHAGQYPRPCPRRSPEAAGSLQLSSTLPDIAQSFRHDRMTSCRAIEISNQSPS